MRMTFLMKIATTVFLVVLGTVFISEYSSPSHGFGTGAPASQTGAPGDGSNCSACHSGAPSTAAGLITSNIPASGYIPGTTYTITANITEAGINKFGFEISPQNTSGNLKGTMIVTNTAETQLISSGKYITHKSGGTAGSSTRTWSFKWVAPAAGSGAVTFYGAFVLANSNSNASGDQVKLSSMAVAENLMTTVAETITNAEEWSVYPNPVNDRLFLKNVNGNYKITNISIFDVNGKLIKVMVDDELQTGCLDVSDLESGAYVLYITSEKGIAKKKILKN